MRPRFSTESCTLPHRSTALGGHERPHRPGRQRDSVRLAGEILERAVTAALPRATSRARRASDSEIVRLASVPMDISCAFATSMATPDQIAEAERLGYV